MMDEHNIEYDGFYLVPGDSKNSVSIKYFKYKNPEEFGEKIDHTDIGDMFHVVFFRNTDGKLVFDEHFEAIFADPVFYANRLAGGLIFGTFMRKTEKSTTRWNNYLTEVKERVKLSDIKIEI